ncbi:hypothetical protein LMH87_001922 [Akanthomyces muscarius]|uniref:Peptidase S33 tripeptidyl aminopeptidase-like C-terminal domain-containing protein n=1 Tax=Akanthomyces muscarius TaxID=2231603 RepID=A0A9W8Q7S2_AKAMU|nr:hypothetical protein LMH87_001922 [Akanthomyces muscarius]KAJ4147401.1 hypothetical protein LMH87_001922 [Akanthomyces muscarius]
MKSHLQAALALASAASVCASAASDAFDWDAITPSHDLEYHACYETFQCARLLLPLDWQDNSSSSSNATIALALIQSPASVPVDDATYAGPVLSNPGGPGGSGVGHLLRAAAQHRAMVDTPGKKHFEFVSFDPRGIGRTTPQVNCYPGGNLARTAATLKARGSGGLNGGPAAVPWNLGLAELAGGRCDVANGELLKYVGTTSVARDMLAVVEKIDEYNKKQKKKTAKKEAKAVEGDAQLELRSVGSDKDDLPRLQYLGFSYGTVLGNYFASMFPERIGRILLDGVCDIDDYATGDGWLSNTVDTDEMVDIFFQGCFDAGTSICPLARSTDKSGDDIAERFWAFVAALDESPTFVSRAGQDDTYILQPNDLRALLLGTMYRPLDLFKQAADTADAAMRGNTTDLYDLLAAIAGGPLEDACPIGNRTEASAEGAPDAQSAVLCGDGDDITGRDTAFWRTYVAKQLQQSAVAGASWGNIRLSCSNWKTRAAWQFHGPFTAPPASKNASVPEKGKPAAPVLFLSNRYDPVTPLRAARTVAAKYPGAGVLVQEAMGHCVFGSRKATECTRDVVRRYFDQGVVPDGETTCEAACEPWGDKCEGVGAMSFDEGLPHDWSFPLHI